MRGYVEMLEQIQADLPEGIEATYEDVMESYREAVDNARDKRKAGED